MKTFIIYTFTESVISLNNNQDSIESTQLLIFSYRLYKE